MSGFVLTLLLVGAVAAMTAAATSVRSVSRIWLRHWAERQVAGDDDQPGVALERSHEYLLAAGTGIAAAVFTLGAVTAFRSDSMDALVQLGVAALMLLLAGQVVPRAIARRWATGLLPALTPILRVLDALFGPILGFAARAVRRIVPAPGLPASPPADPLEDLLRDAEAEGIGEAAESEIISGVVEFGEKRVRDVMTPRDKVTVVTTDMAPGEVTQVVARSNYSRIPVLDPGGAVQGVVHAFDVLVNPAHPLGTLRAAATAAPEEPCVTLMRRMMRDRRHLAVVHDGAAVTGIVTLEDLVEELVGDIQDEHDDPGAAP